MVKNVSLDIIGLWLAMTCTRVHHSKSSTDALRFQDSCCWSHNLDLMYKNAIMNSRVKQCHFFAMPTSTLYD